MSLFRPGGLELTKKAADFIGLKNGDRVLDIGCGLGGSLIFLRDSYGIVPFGADIEPATAEKAKAALGTDCVICADACRLPFDEESFDAIFMECVLTLIPEPVKALREAKRVLSPGGFLVISALEGGKGSLVEEGRICRAELERFLEGMGFELCASFDETASLRDFVAEIIFRYDSIARYIEAANAELGGSVLLCGVPPKGTGYMLMLAKKELHS